MASVSRKRTDVFVGRESRALGRAARAASPTRGRRYSASWSPAAWGLALSSDRCQLENSGKLPTLSEASVSSDKMSHFGEPVTFYPIKIQ